MWIRCGGIYGHVFIKQPPPPINNNRSNAKPALAPAAPTTDAPPPAIVKSSFSPTMAATAAGASLGWRISPRRDDAKTSPLTVPGLSPGQASVATPRVVGGVKASAVSVSGRCGCGVVWCGARWVCFLLRGIRGMCVYVSR